MYSEKHYPDPRYTFPVYIANKLQEKLRRQLTHTKESIPKEIIIREKGSRVTDRPKHKS